MTHFDAACQGREETIHRFLDDDLSPVERAEFLNHVPQCAACQSLLTELQALFAGLERVEEVSPPAGIPSAVMAQLPQPVASPLRSPLGWVALGGQIAVGLILVLLAGRLLWPLLHEGLGQPGWFELTPSVISLRMWLTDLLINIGTWVQTWSTTVPTFNPGLPAGSLLILIPILALAWLIGNGLLLRRYLSTPKNGGAV